MNLIEAIKSGKPFRHKESGSWFERGTGFERIDLPLTWVIDDCWEIQEPSVTITNAQFWEAVGSSEVDLPSVYQWTNMRALALKLGLGEPP